MEDGLRKINTALSEIEDIMLGKLRAGGTVSFSPKGRSMLPMLRESGDSVTLKKPPEKLKKGAVALFTENEGDGKRFILHRLVSRKKGLLFFCGDNRSECDPPVPYENVIGVVVSYVSRGKEHSLREPWYRLYSLWMVSTFRIRRVSVKAAKFIYRIWRKLFRKKA